MAVRHPGPVGGGWAIAVILQSTPVLDDYGQAAHFGTSQEGLRGFAIFRAVLDARSVPRSHITEDMPALLPPPDDLNADYEDMPALISESDSDDEDRDMPAPPGPAAV